MPSTVSVVSGLSWKYIKSSVLVSDPMSFSRRSFLSGGFCLSATVLGSRQEALLALAAYFWIIGFCRGELAWVPERSRLLLCSSRIPLVDARCLSSLECTLFGVPSNCRSSRPILQGRLPETLQSWSQVVAFPKEPRLSLSSCNLRPLRISP